MNANEYIALELHRIKLQEFEQKARTPRVALNEIIAEHKQERRRQRRERNNEK